MSNHPQGRSVAPTVQPPRQCPGCPIGNSMPLIPGEDICGCHSSAAYDNLGAQSCVYDD